MQKRKIPIALLSCLMLFVVIDVRSQVPEGSYASLIVTAAKNIPVIISRNGDFLMLLEQGKTQRIDLQLKDNIRLQWKNEGGNIVSKSYLISARDKGSEIFYIVPEDGNPVFEPETDSLCLAKRGLFEALEKRMASKGTELNRYLQQLNNSMLEIKAGDYNVDDSKVEQLWLQAKNSYKDFNAMMTEYDGMLNGYNCRQLTNAFIEEKRGDSVLAQKALDVFDTFRSQVMNCFGLNSDNVEVAFKQNRVCDIAYWIYATSIDTFLVGEKQSLIYALEQKCNVKVIDYLLETADNNLKYVNYYQNFFKGQRKPYFRLPLTMACINGDIEVVKSLLNAGAKFYPSYLPRDEVLELAEFLWSQFKMNEDIADLIRSTPGLMEDFEGMRNQAMKEIASSMVKVSSGNFTMGCLEWQKWGKEFTSRNCAMAETPIVDVAVNGFYIAKFEITQSQWYAFTKTKAPVADACANCPVTNISLRDAEMFIGLLNKYSGKKYRLPTEVEWEYSARGGSAADMYIFAGADSLNATGWWSKNAGGKLHQIGMLQPNRIGLYDMSGNVYEFTSSFYSPGLTVYQDGKPGETKGNMFVIRGGSVYDDQQLKFRVSYRSGIYPGYRTNGTGFRLVLEE